MSILGTNISDDGKKKLLTNKIQKLTHISKLNLSLNANNFEANENKKI